jgi:hypothetical protein
VSLRAALLADDAAATPGLRYEDFAADWSHPSPLGHAYSADAVVALLARALEHAPREHAHAAGAVQPLAAAALAAGNASALAALPPLAPGNRAESLHSSCFFGDDLRGIVAAASAPPRGWFFDESDPGKPGWRAVSGNASSAEAAEFDANALTLRFRAYEAATVAYTAGWDTADAAFSCAGNCTCDAKTVSAFRPAGRVMEQTPLQFHAPFGGEGGCEVTVRARADAAGRRGFKLLALIAGGASDSVGELYYGVDTIAGDGREQTTYGVVAG